MKDNKTKYRGSKTIDMGMAILGIFMATIPWIPHLETIDDLRLGSCLFGVITLALAIKSLTNGGHL